MEDEGDSLYTDTFAKENGMIIDDVTDDVNYRNTNMTTVFTMADKNNLLYLLNILFFPKKDGCPL
jgi:hypothetical protein